MEGAMVHVFCCLQQQHVGPQLCLLPVRVLLDLVSDPIEIGYLIHTISAHGGVSSI